MKVIALLLLYIFPVFSSEYLIIFRHYSPRSELLSLLQQSFPDLTSTYDMHLSSDFLLISMDSHLLGPISRLEHVKGVYPHHKLVQKPLVLFSGTTGNLPYDILGVKQLQYEPSDSIKIGVFDSGVEISSMQMLGVKQCLNLSSDPDCNDNTGHGTFITSVTYMQILLSRSTECPGIVPISSVYMFKVFSKAQESYTAWFLEAFNRAMEMDIKVVNLSTGGIDYTDEPFVSKIREMVARGMIVVTAAGNDGPGFGSLSNPGDLNEVITVGGLSDDMKDVASFSSRGPTLWEFPSGFGRVKPDVLTVGTNLLGFIGGKCEARSGTSVATPVLAASIALLVKQDTQPAMYHISRVKHCIWKTSNKLPNYSIYEQGAGIFNLSEFANCIQESKGMISFQPGNMDLRSEYFYPFNLQPV
jgi:membrane-bound transcription factor site-1 protease